MKFDACAHGLPQRMRLTLGRRSHERGEVGITGRGTFDRKRDHQECVSPEIGEGRDTALELAGGKLGLEWLGVGREVTKSWGIDQNELKRALEIRTEDGRRLPAVGLERGVDEELGEPRAEVLLVAPELDRLAVG